MRISLVVAAAAALGGLSAPALADDWRRGSPHGWNGYQDVRHFDRRGDRRGYQNGYYQNGGGYYAPARGYPQPGWQGRGYDPRYNGYDRRFDQCRGNSGVAGAVLGAVIGGVLGDQVAQRGDKTMGTVVGAGLGGVLGSTIERSGRDRRCR
ncbi:glycine zipper 2TM domain-containing protein [Polymorphobacter sp.]|uniref:glycine zipper 2TM domain-containing protein n=1 Tax=Polymorphobacter sp. TaxID=1909290 RepID=UPI003F6EA3E2